MKFSLKIYLGGLLLFLGVNVFAQQEYTYDNNGNLISDKNKQISAIHYNHLNLADTITYVDGRKMILTYTGLGQKLSQQSIAANGTVVTVRDYLDLFLYTNDSLREISHEDGRAVPVIPGNTSSAWEYQYHLTDHLGNVRATLTSEPGVDNSTATLETANLTTEQSKFLRYTNARRINAAVFDHTRSTGPDHYSERLTGSSNEKYGLGKSLSVMAGDTIKLEVYAKYVDPSATNNLPSFLALLAQIALGTAPAGTVVDGAGYASSTSSFPFAGMLSKTTNTDPGPKAYLNYLFFDRNFVFKNGGYRKMSTTGKETGTGTALHEKLEMKFTVTEPGYVYAYLSNEETTPVEVYFDDFSVTQVESPVIQQTDYDPFGLAFNAYQRENTAPNNFLYNGKELLADNDLNWYDYGARMYDAPLGRWHVIDPKAEKFVDWSPYGYVMNNPVGFIDPDGRETAEPGPPSDGKNEIIEITEYVLGGPSIWRDVWETAKSIPAGKEIIDAASRRHISIYVHIDKSAVLISGGRPVAGLTGVPGVHQGTTLAVDPKTGRLVVRSDDSFNGLDVQNDLFAGKGIYLVTLATWDVVNTANTLLHEIGAHVLIGRGENTDHVLYGDLNGTLLITVKYDPSIGSYVPDVRSNSIPGSTADKVEKQLGAIAAQRANERETNRASLIDMSELRGDRKRSGSIFESPDFFKKQH